MYTTSASLMIGCVLYFLAILDISGSVPCLSCKNAARPRDCEFIEECGAGETCFLDTYLTGLGHLTFDIGCRDSQQCGGTAGSVGRRASHGGTDGSGGRRASHGGTAGSVGRRASHYTLICSECCSTPLCNSVGCNMPGFGSQSAGERGPVCFNCDQEQTATSCDRIKVCGKHEVCQNHQTRSATNNEIVYESSCKLKTTCEAETKAFSMIAAGGVCIRCCDDDLCNADCHVSSNMTSTVTTLPAGSSPGQFSPNVSSSVVTPTQPYSAGTSTYQGTTVTATSGTPRATATSPPTSFTSSHSSRTSPAGVSTTLAVQTTVTNPCQSNSCSYGTCQPYLDTFRCQCIFGAFGRQCNLLANPCVSSPCIHGTCTSSSSTYNCTCETGYTGTNCDKAIDPCFSNPCLFGYCSSTGTQFACACATGYTGQKCDTAIDFCTSNPCQHGTCKSSNLGYTCMCKPGYSGTTCDTHTDACLSSPCNHGTCINTGTNYTCSCDPGYEGPDCSSNTNDCSPNPCHNGTCFDLVNNFACACNSGFTGSDCSQNIDDCISKACLFGKCIDGINSFTCACFAGFTGTDCSHNIDECLSNPCHGGACVDTLTSHMCMCHHGFTGPDCSSNIDDCSPNPCPHGTCIDGVNNYTCSCDPGYEGVDCTINKDDCSSAPCTNGTCVDGVNSYTCNCDPGFTDVNCTTNIDDCASSQCHNGGTCVDGINSYTCICHPGYTGPDCSKSGATNDCYDILHGKIGTTSGVYTITTPVSKQQLRVHCIMDEDGGGWTVFQNRQNGQVDFSRNFRGYQEGFGQPGPSHEHWLGLKYLAEMTSQGRSELRVFVQAADSTTDVEIYQDFSVAAGPKYTLHVGKKSSPGSVVNGTGMAYNNNMPFSTYDRDMSYQQACASPASQGGWWYDYCSYIRLNGIYLPPGTVKYDLSRAQGIIYTEFSGDASLKASMMMFRRV